MSYLHINGVAMPTPKTFQWDIMDIDGQSTRMANGDMNRDRITRKRKLNIEWGPLSDAQSSTILNAISGEFFQCTYPDAESGGVETRTFYTGDRSAPSFSWNSEFSQVKWNGLKANFIER